MLVYTQSDNPAHAAGTQIGAQIYIGGSQSTPPGVRLFCRNDGPAFYNTDWWSGRTGYQQGYLRGLGFTNTDGSSTQLIMDAYPGNNGNLIIGYYPSLTDAGGWFTGNFVTVTKIDLKGNASFSGNLTVTGTNSRLQNQQITGTASILTKGLADELYMPASTTNSPYLTTTVAISTFMPLHPSSTALGEQSVATGTNAFASGYQVNATGDYSVAMGLNASATGSYSVALGTRLSASGLYSVALGVDARAEGDLSIALGCNAWAEGVNSLAQGCGRASGYISLAFGNWTHAVGAYSFAHGSATQALGRNSFAIGESTIAQSLDQVVIGQYNAVSGDSNNWVLTDEVFTIGNGTSDTSRTNAFVVKKNGDTVISGTATVSGGLNVSGNITTGTSSKLIVTGTNSTRIAPQGDLSMGAFTTEPAQ